jgi:hypothetical protein
MNANPKKVKGAKTRNGKPVWINEGDDEPYSEKSMSFEYADGQIVSPTIDPNTGEFYDLDKLFEHYKENGPYDMYTGEKLPVFEDVTTADAYSIWRSDNMFNFDLSEQEFYTGESGLYSKQDGSDTSWSDKKQDMIDLAAGARDTVYDLFGMSEDEEKGFRLGGLAEATKGITTPEGMEMAKKKFQLDQKKADLDGDGELSKYEETRGEAIQKADADDPDQDEKYGMDCGGMMEPMYDEVSGNPIPIGSTAENVRDDIDIMISEGEYVLPADVVKWHGLKHIMDMQSEAKMGLMGMSMEGLIQYVDEESEEYTECPECDGEGCEHCNDTGYHSTEDSEEVDDTEEVSEDDADVPEEDIEVEYPAVQVEDELDDEDTGEEYPETSALPGTMKKTKFAFIS